MKSPNTKPETERFRNPMALLSLGALSFVILALAAFNISDTSRADKDWPVPIALSALIWLIGYFVLTRLAFGTFYLYGNAFVVVLTIFHLGLTIPQGLGLNLPDAWATTGNYAYWLELSGWYTLLALASYGIGTGLATLIQPRTGDPTLHDPQETLRFMYRMGIGGLIASAVFLTLAISSYGNILEYSRADFFRGSEDIRGWGVFLMIFPVSLTLVVLGATSTTERLFGYPIAILGFIALMLSGYRGVTLYPALAGIITWVKIGRKIPSWVAASTIVFVLLAVPAIGALRLDVAYKDITAERVVEKFQESSIEETLTLGGTGGVLAHALRLVPDKDPFFSGRTYLSATTEAIPNFMPRGEEIKERISLVNDIEVYTPGEWITARVDPERFRNGGGLGFTAIGEAYINFGFLGVIFVFATLGIFFIWLERIDLMSRPYALFFCLTILPFFFRFIRNQFSSLTKPAVFVLIIFFAVGIVLLVIRHLGITKK